MRRWICSLGWRAKKRLGLASVDQFEVRSRRVGGWLVKTFGPCDTVELEAGVTFTVDELYAR